MFKNDAHMDPLRTVALISISITIVMFCYIWIGAKIRTISRFVRNVDKHEQTSLILYNHQSLQHKEFFPLCL